MHATLTRGGFVLALLLAFTTNTNAAVKLPGSGTIEKVDFERHVMGLLGRFGCASGSCHGSFQGKGGLQLSLFGYDPAMDYQNIVRAGNGRRIDLTDPDRSLLLLKATGQVPHEGKTRFGKTSWAYAVLREWIVQGAKRTAGSGTIKSVSVIPGEFAFKAANTSGQLRVQATFEDGSKEDITPLCDFRSNDDSVTEVNNLGGVKSLRPGDTAVIVSYRGSVVPVRMLVPAPVKSGFVYPKTPTVNFIDAEVFAKLKRMNMVPSNLSTDSEFLRRVYLDTIGTLPAPDAVRKFLADKSSNKREKVIDELLKHPMHAALWATKFCDITGNNTDALEQPPQRRTYLSQMWHDWFRKRVANNMPYDQIVKGVLTAKSIEGKKSVTDYIKEVEAFEEAQDKAEPTKYADRETLDLFWRRQQRVTIEEWGEKTAAAFLGVRLECAQCHKHPFDRWTQADYRAYANIFASVNFAVSPKASKEFRAAQTERQKKSQKRLAELRRKGAKIRALPVGPLREVFIGRSGRLLTDPNSNRPLSPKALGGPEIKVASDDDPRDDLWKWMVTKDNPLFARSFVNRVWGHYFGVGIVHPVDDFSLANPPTNEKLLNALAAEFIKNKFDIRKLEKSILLSRTYQLSSTPNDTNRFDKNNYARSYVRPLMAEVVVDTLNTAIGTSERWLPGEAAPNARTIEVGASRVQNQNVNFVLQVFGRPPRAAACDCERAMDPALPQKLFLMADTTLQTKLQGQNRLTDLLKAQDDDDKVLEELVLATLSRMPTAKERAWFAEYKKEKKGLNRRALFNDTLWALINTTEFISNH